MEENQKALQIEESIRNLYKEMLDQHGPRRINLIIRDVVDMLVDKVVAAKEQGLDDDAYSKLVSEIILQPYQILNMLLGQMMSGTGAYLKSFANDTREFPLPEVYKTISIVGQKLTLNAEQCEILSQVRNTLEMAMAVVGEPLTDANHSPVTHKSSRWVIMLLLVFIVLTVIIAVVIIAGSNMSKGNEIKEMEEFENLPAMTLDSTQNKEKVQSASDSIAVSYAARLLELRSAPIGLRTDAPTYIDLLEFSKEGTNPIVITKFFYTYTTGKGGPNMMFGFVNTSDKTIEHIEFECGFMDNPEEVMHGFARCFYDKPLKPNERTENDYWVWVESGVLRRGLDGFFEEASRMARLNNESFRIARYIILGTVKITYTDGTTVYAYKEKSA